MRTSSAADPSQELRRAMSEAGIRTADPIVADGEIHRVHAEGDRRGSKNAWYVLYADGTPAGAFGSWKGSGVTHTWRAGGESRMDSAEHTAFLRRVEAAHARRKEDLRRVREAAAREAQRLLDAAPAADPNHPYLRAKQIAEYDLRQDGADLLMSLVGPDGSLRGLQRIKPDGFKQFPKGTEAGGSYHLIGSPNGTVVISEGYATAATVHAATGHAAVAALFANNLPRVAKAIRARFPNARIIIAGDNDLATEGNPGRTRAEEAAAVVGGVAVIPEFGEPSKGGDWNDYGALHGLTAVAEAIRGTGPIVEHNGTDSEPSEGGAGVQLEDFYAYMPDHNYIFAPTREVWPAASVNARIPLLLDASGKEIKASKYLDQNRPVEQMTWTPGEPMVIEGRLIAHGGWIRRPGCQCFNLYRAATIARGDAAEGDRWAAHIHMLYPNEANHIIKWLAHRVQRPAEKINHALVLGGSQGIGKDASLEPVKHAVGPWNFREVAPTHLLGRFNGFVKSVILRVSEARDLGDVDRYGFYEHMKTYTAAPPDVLLCDEKNLREYSVQNVCGVIITTNHKTNGIYLPADDRRHFVAWSELTKDDFAAEYWTDLFRWYASDGHEHVAAYLAEFDLSDFDPKAPPPKTAAFWDIVDANRSPEDAELADALERLGNPHATTLTEIANCSEGSFGDWMRDRRNSRQIPHRMEAAGYVPIRNDRTSDGRWKVGGKNQVIYVRRELSRRDQLEAASTLAQGSRL